MPAFKVSLKIDTSGELHLGQLPFGVGEEVEVTIESRAPEAAWVQQLPPVTRSLLGAARGAETEDYRQYLEEKYR